MKLIKPHLSKVLSGMVLLMLTVGCDIDEIDNLENAKMPELSPNVMVNIGSISYTMDSVLTDFIEDQSINNLSLGTGTGDQSNEFRINYVDTISFTVTPDATELIALDNFNSSDSIESDPLKAASDQFGNGTLTGEVNLVDAPLSFADEQRKFTDTIQVFDVTTTGTDERLDTLEFSGGTFSIDLSSTYSFDVSEYILSIPGIEDIGGGNAIENVTLNATDGAYVVQLADKQLTLIEDNDGNPSLVIEVELVSIEENGKTAPATPSVIVSGTINVADEEISVIRGFFGSDKFAVESISIELDALDDFRDITDLTFSGIQTTLVVSNELGAPVQLDFSDFIATGGSSGDLSLGDALEEGQEGVDGTTATIPAASSVIYTSGTAEVDASEITFVFGGDAMDDIINDLPTAMVSPDSATPNPDVVDVTDAENTHNFMNTTSKLEIIATVGVPLSVTIDEYIIDTIEVDVDLESIDSAISMIVGINAINTLPFNAYAEIYADDDYTLMLNDSSTVFSRTEDVKAVEHKIGISDPDKMSALLEAKKLNVIVSLDTDGGNAVAVTNDMTLELDFYVNGEIVFDPN